MIALCLCCRVCNPTLILVIARQSACRVNIRGNSGHTSASAPHHRPVAQLIAWPARAWHLYPPVGSGKCSALKPPQPARNKYKPPGLFLIQSKSIDIPRPHQVEGNLHACSVRSSSMHPGGLCLPVSRSASSDGQSHAADDPAGQSVTQRPTRPDLMSCVRFAPQRTAKGKSRDHSQLSVCPVVSVSPVPILDRNVSRMYACTLMPASAAAWRMRAPSSLLGRIVMLSCLLL